MATPQAQGFGNVGATPSFGDWTNQINQGFSSNPFAKALNTIQSGSTVPYKNPQTGVSFSPQGAVGAHDAPIPVGTNPGIIHPSGQAIKSQTKTNVDGSSQSVTYHPPAAQASYQGGQALPAVGTPEYAQAQKLANPTPTATGTTSNTGTAGGTSGSTGSGNTFTGATQGLINQGQGGAATGTSIQGLGNVANQTNTGNAGVNQAVQGTNQGILTNIAQNQTPEVIAAEKAYAEAANNPYMIGALTNSGMAESVSAGAGQQFAQNYQNTLAAKQQEVQNALTGENQQVTSANEAAGNALTGQGQQVTAGTNAGTLANTAQGNQITAQNYAGGLTQPSVAGYGQTVFNPATGTYSGGGAGVSPTDPFYQTMQQYAAMAANGQISAIPSSITGNSVLNAQVNQMARAINPNYNPVVSAAQGAAAASNVSTTGTAAVNAANTGYQGAVQEYQNNTAHYTALTGISNQLTGTLANYANNGVLTDANAAINTIQGHLSNPDYQKFITAMGNAQASYQAILGSSGVTPTKADQDAVAALNPNSSATAIIAALNQLSADAHSLIIVPSYQKVQNYKTQLGIQ